MIKKKWIANNSKTDLILENASETGLDEGIIRILSNRGIDNPSDIEKFLNPSYDNMFDPYLLNDMDKAVERIKEAVKKEEKIFIYGDYDVDGVTASSLLYIALKEIYEDISIYIPEREAEGYGLNKGAVEKIKNMGGSLIITVDCGITSVDEVNFAKELNIDMIVTDHHTCPSELPKAYAVINPKREDSTYPFRELCGAGVAFKLCEAMNLKNEKLIAIAAVGTIADIVPLVSENRIIAHYGLKAIREGILENINELTKVAGADYKSVTARTVSFAIAPRINAAGRMATAKEAVEFFITDNKEKMIYLAKHLDELNLKRQSCEKNIYEEARNKIEENKEYLNDILVVWGKDWHEGVIGIVASKLTEQYYKPCILISVNEGVGKGSSRSIKGFNIYDALSSVSECLEKFGGHELAAGLTVKEEKLDEFKKKILENSAEIFENSSFLPEIMLDCELKENNITVEYAEQISHLEPFGMGNSEPLFLIKSVSVKNSFAFSDGKHMRLIVKKGNKELELVGFGLGSYASSLRMGDKIHIAANIGINDFRGVRKLQGIIRDIKLEK